MEYKAPFGSVDPNASYSNGNAGAGIKGSIPHAKAIEDPQREILAVIAAAGLTPNGGVLTQLRDAITSLISSAIPSLTAYMQKASNLSDVADVAAARSNLGLGFGNCRLALSGGNLVLSRYGGKLLSINGVPQVIPQAGVSLAPTGLTPATFYYIYAYMNGVNMALEASTTGHSMHTTSGMEIKTGDATRTLVGAALVGTGPTFNDAAGNRHVLSWFNRMQKSSKRVHTSNVASTSSTFFEINSGLRTNFISWADEEVLFSSTSMASNTGQFGITTAVGFNSTTTYEQELSNASNVANGYINCAFNGRKAGLTENAGHYAALLGSMTPGGTSTWWGAATGPIVLTITING